MSLTAQLFDKATNAQTTSNATQLISVSCNAQLPPSTINFTPVQKAKIDLFARAPQVRKLSRREKRKLSLSSNEMNTSSVNLAAKTPIIQRNIDKTEINTVDYAQEDGNANVREGINGNTVLHNNNLSKSQLSTHRPIFESICLQDSQVTTHRVNSSNDNNISSSTTNDKHKLNRTKRTLLRHALHSDPQQDRRTVFVGNLPNTIQKRQVEKIFKKCGQIESVRIRCQALEPVNATSKDVGRAIRVLRKQIRNDSTVSAIAYVLFKTQLDVCKALQINGMIFGNRHIVVTTLDVTGKFYSPQTSVFIGNITPNTVQQDVWNFFINQKITNVKRVRLVRDRDSGACKGFGYVQFQHPSSVKAAIASRGNMCNGRPIRIVHVNQAKDAKASMTSRRQRRMSQFDLTIGQNKRRDSSINVSSSRQMYQQQQQQQRQQQSKNYTRSSKRFRDGVQVRQNTKSSQLQLKRVRDKEEFPWMGVVTNPRKKIPRDLRQLAEPKKENAKRSKTLVKHKTRNPEKHDN